MNDYKRDGISEAGAPMYKGKWNKPPIAAAMGRTFFLFTSVLFVWCAVSSWHKPPGHPLLPIEAERCYQVAKNVLGFALAVFVGSSGVWMLKTRYQMRHLQTTDQICTRFGIGDDVFHAWREEQTIKPHININGTDYYRPADFVDAGTLLRASAQPVTPETLLRPTVSIEATPTEQLLRAAE